MSENKHSKHGDESSPLKRLKKRTFPPEVRMVTATSNTRAGRKKPYTVQGIGRVACVRCGQRADSQWQACADGLWRPICVDCDVALNALVLQYMGDPDADAKVQKYKATLC